MGILVHESVCKNRVFFINIYRLSSLAADVGALSLTPRFKKTIPTSHQSVYTVQGDIGFFYYRKKTYGMFLLFVNTFTKRIFVTPIPNTKSESLIEGIGKMLQVGGKNEKKKLPP
jgi:hypothetical protein